MVFAFYFFVALYFSSFGFGNQIVTSNDGLPGGVSLNGNDLMISSFPILGLQLQTLIPGTVKFFMDLPDACQDRTITLSYGASECKISYVAIESVIKVNDVRSAQHPTKAQFTLTNNKVTVNGFEYDENVCSSMNNDIYKLSIIGSCSTPITFFSTAIILPDPTTSTSTSTTTTSTSTRTSTNTFSTSTLSDTTQQFSHKPVSQDPTSSLTSPVPIVVDKQTQSHPVNDTTVSGIVHSGSFPWELVGGIAGGLLLLGLIIGAFLVGYCCLWKKRPGAKNEIPGETTFGINEGGEKVQGRIAKAVEPKSIVGESVAGTTAATTTASSIAAPDVADFHLPPTLLVVLPGFGPTVLPSGYKEAAEKIMHKVIGQVQFRNEVRQVDVFSGKEFAEVAALDAALLEECQEVFAAFVRARFEYLHKAITKQAVYALVETFVHPAAIQKAKIDVQHVQFGYEAIDEFAEPVPFAPPGSAPSPYNALKQLQQPPPSTAAPATATVKPQKSAATKPVTTAGTTKTTIQKTMAPSKSKMKNDEEEKRRYFKSRETQTITTTRPTAPL